MHLLEPFDQPSDYALIEVLRQRRQRLAAQVNGPVVLWSGGSPARNFPANVYPFRASSHFLYFAGFPIEQAAIRLEQGRLELFMNDPSPVDQLWHGATPTREHLAAQMGANAAYPLEQLASRVEGAATIAVQDSVTRSHQSALLRRPVDPSQPLQGRDGELAKAMVSLRLEHDEGAIAEMRRAIAITLEAHQAGMWATPTATHEAQIRAAMEAVIMAHNVSTAYSSIVTVHGDILHNTHYHHALHPGDLVLADVGAESALGWASDVTRTWPVSGRFSATQRAIYEVVRAAHDQCIALVRPGVEYQTLHLKAATVLAEGLVDLGILRGTPADLVEQDAPALFFPHGIGHLLGLDVHDMEDLGDLAGYTPGRVRSDRPGLCYLRLHRPLQVGMVVTIEPGFYQVSALLRDPEHQHRYATLVNWNRLAEFADVRGIRIEDDVLVTETGSEVLTAALPTAPEAIEALMRDASASPSIR